MNDLEIMAKTVYGEARGEAHEGRVAVAQTILNRLLADTWYGDTLAEVCLKPFQFSCWNEDDPNLVKLTDLSLARSSIFAECMIACLDALRSATDHDPTNGATHYHTKSISPYWAMGKNTCAEIGNHLFYNDVD